MFFVIEMTDPIQNQSIDSIVRYYEDMVQDTDSNIAFRQALDEAYLLGRNRGTNVHPEYTRVDIEGKDGFYATFTRKKRSDFIDVEILTSEIELESAVPVNDVSQHLIAAEHIYRELEDDSPTPADIDRYMRPFEHLTGSYNGGGEYGR